MLRPPPSPDRDRMNRHTEDDVPRLSMPSASWRACTRSGHDSAAGRRQTVHLRVHHVSHGGETLTHGAKSPAPLTLEPHGT